MAHHLTADSLETATFPRGPAFSLPSYDRARLRRSIVHIGVGGFHRAHLATFIDELAERGETGWSIVGAGVLPGDAKMAATLRAQDHLYALITRGVSDASVRVVGSIVDYIHAVPEAEALVEQIAAPDTQIVSLTVTEGGYPVDDATGDYRPDSPSAGPDSAFGRIAAGLQRRRAAGVGPLTILSCDNILANGHATRTATLGAAGELDASLPGWIAANVTFPNSMVDRITPATTDADRAWLIDEYDLIDDWPVVTEPFRQWVVEDHFAGDRPPLEHLDVIVTDDVEPYEMMKLRLLNAGHSCLAYLSALESIETVDRALADPSIRAYLHQFLRTEALPVVTSVPGVDLDEYVETLIDRFSNPNIGDQISRLCLDGTAKFPKFLMPTVASQLEAGGSVALAALAIAGWCEYLRLGSDPVSPITLSPDPDLDRAVQAARASLDEPAAFLDLDMVFEPTLRTGRFADAFTGAVEAIRTDGVRSAIDGALI